MTLLSLLLLGVGCAQPLPPPTLEVAPGWHYTQRSAEIMSTRIDVIVPDGPEISADEAAEIVFDVFRDIEGWANEWREGSALTQVNRAAGGEPVSVPPELLSLICRSLEMSEQTGGAFDITWAALWGLWDFRANPPRVPSPEKIQERLPRIGWSKVEIDEAAGTVRLPEAGMAIGLGGVAKGYALDKAAAALRERGIESFNLSAGGQILAAGEVHAPGSAPRPWRVGVRDPRGESQDFFASVEVIDASVSTSGDYERYFELDGVRFHHILDLRTGYPSRAARSATVICPEATLADALSTALMVLGPEGIPLLEEIPGAEALVVDASGGVHFSEGLREKAQIWHPPHP